MEINNFYISVSNWIVIRKVEIIHQKADDDSACESFIDRDDIQDMNFLERVRKRRPDKKYDSITNEISLLYNL